MLRKIMPVLSALLLAACSSQQRHIQYLDGIDPVIHSESIKTSTKNQNSVFQSLYCRAGLNTKYSECNPAPATEDTPAKPATLDIPDPIRSAGEWDDVIRAGMDYVDEECELYVNSIFWAHRATDTSVKNLGLIGATTGTVLGLADASATNIGYVAAAFGLSAALIDSTASGLLYKLDPSVVRAVIENSRTAYRTAFFSTKGGVPDLRRNKPGTAAAIRG